MNNHLPLTQRLLRRLPEVLLAVVALALLFWMVPTLAFRRRAVHDDERCSANLQAIYQAIQEYRKKNGGEYPHFLVTRGHNDPGALALAPDYLKDVSTFVCPADPKQGAVGWDLPCSYEYCLQSLSSANPKVRKRVKTELIEKLGPRLRLLVCGFSLKSSRGDRGIPGAGLLTIRADGTVVREPIPVTDPQSKLQRSF